MAEAAGVNPPFKLNTLVAFKETYRLISIIGKGNFGYIYKIANNKNKYAAMKVEKVSSGPLFCEQSFYTRCGTRELITEWAILHDLKYLSIPYYIDLGIYNGFRCLVIQLCERSLANDIKLQMQPALLLAIRMLEALQYIHMHDFVHADIKNANILIRGDRAYLGDFGLSTKFMRCGQHVIYEEKPKNAHDGTKELTSIDAHLGVTPSRRGDLQILGYCIISWLSGNKLPWFNWNNLDKIKDAKKFYQDKMPNLVDACVPLSLRGFKDYLQNVFKLEYSETPNYENLFQYLKSDLIFPDTGYVIW
jgi:vaccinia related kinase